MEPINEDESYDIPKLMKKIILIDRNHKATLEAKITAAQDRELVDNWMYAHGQRSEYAWNQFEDMMDSPDVDEDNFHLSN